VFTIDCPGSVWEGGGESPTLELGPSVAILRHLTISNAFENATQPAIQVTGSGTLIIDDCLIQSASGAALNITPNGAFNLVVTNTRIAKNASGIVIQPSSGGSVTATLDHVIIVQNNGGGLKIDTANGPVTTDITDSVISDNSGNGINAVGNAGGQAIISIKNSVIAKNGVAGVQANGANAGVLIATTLLDQNVSGATAVVGGGNLFTYGNNDIVGSIGSGFTGTATMH
jgi:hypothetical protein